MEDSELEDLEHLVASPGWRRYSEEVSKGDSRFYDRVEKLLTMNVDDVSFVQELRSTAAVRNNNRRLLSWPVERISQLRRVDARPAGKVRGTR